MRKASPIEFLPANHLQQLLRPQQGNSVTHQQITLRHSAPSMTMVPGARHRLRAGLMDSCTSNVISGPHFSFTAPTLSSTLCTSGKPILYLKFSRGGNKWFSHLFHADPHQEPGLPSPSNASVLIHIVPSTGRLWSCPSVLILPQHSHPLSKSCNFHHIIFPRGRILKSCFEFDMEKTSPLLWESPLQLLI